eukprot:2117502-Alexandrium_andersonii.AAC.1
MRCLPLLDALVDKGAKQCVVLSHQFEAALSSILAKRPSLSGNLTKFAAHDITNHVQTVCKVLRMVKREQDSVGKARTSKVGPLRKHLSSADRVLLSQTLAKV